MTSNTIQQVTEKEGIFAFSSRVLGGEDAVENDCIESVKQFLYRQSIKGFFYFPFC